MPAKLDPVTIYGSEGVSVQLAPCCLPIPGDQIIGQLRRDQGLMVHAADCYLAKRLRAKEPDRWIDVHWGTELNRRFDCRISVLIHNEKGILARVAAEIGESDANIIYVGMDEDKDQLMTAAALHHPGRRPGAPGAPDAQRAQHSQRRPHPARAGVDFHAHPAPWSSRRKSR